ncbi:hypothetical protein [Vibrio coralliilyticus]|nr:hypothetical protein [Vibrio coralliilyticus]MCC2524200.1 hypothetical protein [Vibrio coralliilyticus]
MADSPRTKRRAQSLPNSDAPERPHLAPNEGVTFETGIRLGQSTLEH